jgi:hypothetical protein
MMTHGVDLATFFYWIENHKKSNRKQTITSIYKENIEHAEDMCKEEGVQCTRKPNLDHDRVTIVISNLEDKIPD